MNRQRSGQMEGSRLIARKSTRPASAIEPPSDTSRMRGAIHSQYTAIVESDKERWAACLALFKVAINSDELAAIRANIEQQRALRACGFKRKSKPRLLNACTCRA